VGAALEAKSGAVFVGCNVENASYGATICAERAALAAAIAAGERELVALAIVSGANEPIPPCGICRQCLAELAPELSIRSFTDDAQTDFALQELLPNAFDAKSLT
jgi:cytidine deaminase